MKKHSQIPYQIFKNFTHSDFRGGIEKNLDLKIEKIAVTLFGTVKLKSLLIKDHHKDTLLSVKQLNTNFIDFYNLDQWKRGDLIFGDIRLIDFYLNIKNYKGEKYTNLDKFIEVVDDGKPSSGKFLMTADAIYIEKGKFSKYTTVLG